jgi:Haemolymph juvenile hormone binding protein (JHBP)
MCFLPSANVEAHIVMSGNEEKRKGGTYVSLKDRSVDLEIGGATMYFDNLFNGNKQLGKSKKI